MNALESGLRRAVSEEGLLSTEEGFRAFYERTARGVWAYLARTTTPQLADDLLQEAYLRMLRSHFEPESLSHASNYLYRIATNLTHDHFRRQGQSPVLDDEIRDEDAVAPGTPLQDRLETTTDVNSALASLNPRDRQLLWLAHVEGMTHDEIATILSLKSTSIRSMLFRARHRLAEMLRRLDHPDEVTP